MREMKDSGMIRLKYVVDIFGRIGFRGYTEQDLVDENEGAITLSPSNIQNMKMDYSKCSFLTWQKYYESPEIKIKNGDVLFVKTGSTYGKVGYVENLPMEATINPQLVVFKNISMNSKLLFYMLQMSFVKDQCELAVVGGTIPTMSQVKIGNIYILFPSLAEQQRIAEFLDRECGKIDGLKADIQTQIDTLEQYKRSVITEAVTHGLNPSAPMKDSGVPWVGNIPKHWNCCSLKYNYNTISGATPNSNDISLWDGEIVWVTPADYKTKDVYVFSGARKITYKGYLSCSTTLIKQGNIIFSKRAPIGSVAINKVELCTSQGCLSVVRKTGNVNNKYFYYLFSVNDETFNLFGSGTTFKEISAKDFLSVKFPLPPLDEQQEIADYLDNKCAEIEQIITDKKTQIETLDGYKKSLIYEYVTGKKEVV